MTTITISLSDAQYKGLEFAALDPQHWIENLVKVRADTAVDEVVAVCVQKCLENNIQIPGSKDDIVELAFAQSWVNTAADREAQSSNPIPE